jgi:hypothetical protein
MKPEEEKELLSKVNYIYKSQLASNDLFGKGHAIIITLLVILCLRGCGA